MTRKRNSDAALDAAEQGKGGGMFIFGHDANLRRAKIKSLQSANCWHVRKFCSKKLR